VVRPKFRRHQQHLANQDPLCKGGATGTLLKVNQANGMVVVPLVNINEPSESTAGTVATGRYAWFVQDEGVKAKYNIVDPYAGQTALTTGTPAQQALSRYRYNAPMRTGMERMYPTLNSYAKHRQQPDDLQQHQLDRVEQRIGAFPGALD